MQISLRDATRLARWLIRSRTGFAGAVIVAGALFLALWGPWLAPQDPNQQDLKCTLLAPSWSFRSGHVLGTDPLGRDMLSRLMYGARTSMIIGISVAGLSSIFGTLIGLVSGYYGRTVDTLAMRITDVFLGFPTFLLAISMAAVLGQGLRNTVLALTLTGWMTYTRVSRGDVLRLKEREFTQAAIVCGCTNRRIIFRHMLPNSVSSSIILATLDVGRALILEAGLTFVGVGVPLSTITWGQMLAGGRNYLFTAWWLTMFPGIAITIAVLGFNFLGDSLRDVLDPTLRHER